MEKRHEGRIAVITGAAGGLMRPSAIRLANEGCHLALTDREPCTDIAERVKEHDPEVYHEQCDLSSSEAVDRLVKNVLNRFERVNAPRSPVRGILKPFSAISIDQSDKTRTGTVSAVWYSAGSTNSATVTSPGLL